MTTSRVISGSPANRAPVRIDPATFGDWQGLLDLILAAFAYMNGVIDPPSSALKLTAHSIEQKARDEIGYVIHADGKLAACAFFRPEPPDCLYISASSPSHRPFRAGVSDAPCSTKPSPTRDS